MSDVHAVLVEDPAVVIIMKRTRAVVLLKKLENDPDMVEEFLTVGQALGRKVEKKDQS